VITLEEIRGFATALPGVEETAHFDLPTFTVGGEGFVGLEKSRSTLIAAVDQDDAAAAVAGDADLFEEVWRGGTFVGVRLDLARAPVGEVQRLIEAAWRNKAPEELLAEYGD
jgi:hypothetical protein